MFILPSIFPLLYWPVKTQREPRPTDRAHSGVLTGWQLVRGPSERASPPWCVCPPLTGVTGRAAAASSSPQSPKLQLCGRCQSTVEGEQVDTTYFNTVSSAAEWNGGVKSLPSFFISTYLHWRRNQGRTIDIQKSADPGECEAVCDCIWRRSSWEPPGGRLQYSNMTSEYIWPRLLVLPGNIKMWQQNNDTKWKSNLKQTSLRFLSIMWCNSYLSLYQQIQTIDSVFTMLKFNTDFTLNWCLSKR